MLGNVGKRQVEPRGCHCRRSRHPRLRGGVVVTTPTAPAPFTVVRASDLQSTSAVSPPWLIEQLWSANAVGILGGAPKSLKTWMALEMAIAVASGSSCLGQFAVPASGP